MKRRRGRPPKVTKIRAEELPEVPDELMMDPDIEDSGEPPIPENILRRRPTPKRPKAERERARCPRCGGTNTLATSTQTGDYNVYQHRICRAPICRHRYKRLLNR